MKILEKNTTYYLCGLILLIIIYGGVSFTKLGLYSDDWERIHLYEFTNTTSFVEKVNLLVTTYPTVYYRISQVFLYPFSSLLGDLVHNQIYGMHLLSLCINYLTFISIFHLIKKFAMNPIVSFIYSAFLITLPGRSASFFWGSTQTQMVAILFFYLILNLHFSKKFTTFISSILIMLFTIVALWSYEVVLFIPLLFPVFFLISRDRRDLFHFLSASVGAFIVLFYKFYLYSHIFNFENIKKLDKSSYPISYQIQKFYDLSAALFDKAGFGALFNYWANYIDNTMLFILISTILLICTVYLLAAGKLNVNKRTIYLAVIGFGIIFGSLAAYTPVFQQNSSFYIFGKHSRFTTLPVMGFGFLFLYLHSMFKVDKTRYPKISWFMIILVSLCLNLYGLNRERVAYVKSWKIQQNVLSKIDYSLVKGNRSVFIFAPNNLTETDFSVPVFSDFWTLTYSLSIYSQNRNLEADFSNNPKIKLEGKSGYTSKYWDKKYYDIKDIYYVDFKKNNPQIVPLIQ